MTPAMLEEASVAEVAVPADRLAQRLWAATPIAARLAVLRRFRHELARSSERMVEAIPRELARTRADSYGAEILPLLAACRFLEQQAQRILKPRRLGMTLLPLWMAGISGRVERVPHGVVLIVAPANYPLLLAGVQTLQALAAGNAVVWKPGRNGGEIVRVFLETMRRAGLPEGVLRITDDSVEAATREIAARPDKIVFTGSGEAGRAVLRAAAGHATPAVAELSGCDAVVVLESANLDKAIEALCFGMRLNGSSTCMAPRRLFLLGRVAEDFTPRLRERFAAMDGIEVTARTREQLRALLADAEAKGATVCGDVEARLLKPLLVLHGQPEMKLAQADIFAPVLTVLHAADVEDLLRQDALCPFGLAASIFGDEGEASALASRLTVGSVIVNDVLAPTVDPRVSFGGRRGSGFGVTRGVEGLLDMTVPKSTLARKGSSTLHYQKTDSRHEAFFRAAVAMSHGETWSERFTGLRAMVAAAMKLK
jgi:aldehyde dehydrogenase (NAD+)